MPADLHELLDDAVARSPVPDVDTIWRAGRRRARRRAVGVGVATLSGTIALAVVLTSLGPPRATSIDPVERTPRPGETISQSDEGPQRPALQDVVTHALVPADPFQPTGPLLLDRNGRRQELPTFLIVDAVMLGDGTLMWEGWADTPSTGPPLWAAGQDGDVMAVDGGRNDRASRQLVGTTPDQEAALILIEGRRLQAWTPGGDRETVATIPDAALPSGNPVGRRASIDANGNLAVATTGATRLRLVASDEVRTVIPTAAGQTIRDLTHVDGRLVVLVDRDLGDDPAQLVVLDPTSGTEQRRIALPVATSGPATFLTQRGGTVAVQFIAGGGARTVVLDLSAPDATIQLDGRAFIAPPLE